ncbi:hypothetical protein J2X16_003587 [Pelomonas aquatica]|uniref:DUF6970 domain-containing protein n=1 Tax=Pelomonas aquatica TaxID=431058 RepID=A0ABU1ZC70_9BURK|nr:hypothetical protein [Pelomonas aquatica]MDR7298224.1 hypothetical protein [Pelomonas aquatica]
MQMPSPRHPWRLAAAAALPVAAAIPLLLTAFGSEAVLPLGLPDPAVLERIRSYEDGTTRRVTDIMRLEHADGRAYYQFTAPCCDIPHPLYDAEGRYVCAPRGGFAGEGDGRCPAWVRGLRLSLPRHLQTTAPARPLPAEALQGY